MGFCSLECLSSGFGFGSFCPIFCFQPIFVKRAPVGCEASLIETVVEMGAAVHARVVWVHRGEGRAVKASEKIETLKKM